MAQLQRIIGQRFAPFARKLELRIVALFIGLLLLVQFVSFGVIRHSIDDNAHAQIDHELRSGESVLRRLLAHDADRLSEASRLLAADYGFRSAVAGSDRLTLVDALDNQAARIGATVALFTDDHRKLIASTSANPAAAVPLARADIDALGVMSPRRATANVMRLLDGEPVEFVTVPVKAPQLIGYVSMGFAVDVQLFDAMQELASMKMALVTRGVDGRWRVLPNGQSSPDLAVLESAFSTGKVPAALELNGNTHVVRFVALGSDVGTVLLRSFDEAVAPYRRLQLTLLAITLVGLWVFGVGSFFTARSITRPIKALSLSADRLGRGDYTTPLNVSSRDEVHELAQSFEAMRVGMQLRDAEIRKLAYWDSLTGLPNRTQFADLLRDRVVAAQATRADLAVLVFGLDRFKSVNDVLGRSFGDRLLRRVAERISAGVLRNDDLFARLDGDQFVVCLAQTGHVAALAMAERLRHALERPLTLDDHTIDVSAAIGITAYPLHAVDADTLLRRAELAMDAAKSGRAAMMVYRPELDSSSQESLSLLTDLRSAIAENELRLYLQPKIDLATGAVVGAEALIRWQHPVRGLVPPVRFIPFAEQTGFISAITGWMIERCAQRQQQLQTRGLQIRMSINLSARDLLDFDLPAKVERMLARSAVDPNSICLEITESSIMDDPQRALGTLQRLHEMGLHLSIDDFGTGYSSLAYLKRLPLDELKIDQSFVQAMEEDRNDLSIVRSTIDLAHNLGLSVVAEGVETAQAWALLRALGCDQAQGYLVAKPMPEDDFMDWVAVWAQPEARLRTEFAELVG